MAEIIAKLMDASIHGNVAILHKLLKIDALILDRCIIGCYTETPLHISAMRGHASFTKEILAIQPEMATERSLPQKLTPLHLASAKGYVEIVKMLLMVNSDMCYATDYSGKNPLHIAAMKGRIDVLKEFVEARPLAARDLVEEGDTILHLCVKYNQVDALILLVEKCITENSGDAFVNCKNDGGDTILHLAVADKQIMVRVVKDTILAMTLIFGRQFESGLMGRVLIKDDKLYNQLTKVDVNAINANGFTSLDILAQSRRDVNDMLIFESLKLAGCRRARDLSCPSIRIINSESYENSQPDQTLATNRWEQENNWVEKMRNSLMVVASLVATMAFQAGINPVGGVWQDNSKFGHVAGSDVHRAGTSIMANIHPEVYHIYTFTTTISFVASLNIILLLLSGLPEKRKFFMWILMVIIWIAISALGRTYYLSMGVLTPNAYQTGRLRLLLDTMIRVWLGSTALLLLVQTIRFLVEFIRKFITFIKKRAADANHSSIA